MEQAGVEPQMRGTVRDFKNFVQRETGTQTGTSNNFSGRSEEHAAFWQKLNRIGARNMESQPPESVRDIDATVNLTQEEWTELETEFDALPKYR